MPEKNNFGLFCASIFLVLFFFLLSAPVYPVQAAAFPTLNQGDTGSGVVTLQGDLIQLGYLSGNADGVFGPYTAGAVLAFQKSHGLFPDGVAGSYTWTALTQAITPQPATPAAAPNLSSSAMPTLQYGATGTAVTTLQGDLIQVGYLSGQADGIFGALTRTAVGSFQRAQNLTTDGIVGPLTWAALVQSVTEPSAGTNTAASPATGTQAPSASIPATSGGTPTPSVSTPVPSAGLSSRGSTTTTANHLQIQGYYVQYVPGDPNNDSWSSLQTNYAQLTSIAPLWVEVRPDGSLYTHGPNWGTITAFAKAHGIKVLVMVTNEYGSDAVLTDPAARANAVANIKSLVVANGFSGVNVDFESLAPGDRNGLSAFVEGLANALHPAGYLVTVDVASKDADVPALNPTAAAYDYATLALYADQEDIMAYDYHGSWSGPGAVAPLPWVKSCLNYALSTIPAAKIMLGVAAYGYDWSYAGVPSLTSSQAIALANQHGSTIHWDSTSAEPWFTYTDGYGDLHTVWFEDGASVASKLALAQASGIAGLAIWHLGGEDAAFWPDLNGSY